MYRHVTQVGLSSENHHFRCWEAVHVGKRTYFQREHCWNQTGKSAWGVDELSFATHKVMVLRAQTDLSDVSIHETNGFGVFFALVVFPGDLMGAKRLRQFTCGFPDTNRQKQTWSLCNSTYVFGTLFEHRLSWQIVLKFSSTLETLWNQTTKKISRDRFGSIALLTLCRRQRR